MSNSKFNNLTSNVNNVRIGFCPKPVNIIDTEFLRTPLLVNQKIKVIEYTVSETRYSTGNGEMKSTMGRTFAEETSVTDKVGSIWMFLR